MRWLAGLATRLDSALSRSRSRSRKRSRSAPQALKVVKFRSALSTTNVVFPIGLLDFLENQIIEITHTFT